LGAAPWLVDRLDSLNFTFPTTIQINAMESVNEILNSTDEMVESASLEERIGMNDKDLGLVISGSTGSGKTLAYLVPLLSTLSDSLFVRQRIRVGAEENVGDTTGDMLERISVVTSPIVRTSSRRPIKRGGPIATGASLATLGKSGKDVKSPLALVVVPTKELGVQTAMILYELIGGNIKKDATEIRGKANMFKYKGPKGVRIGCVLDDEEASFGLKLQTDVAVTMPEYLDKLIADGDLVPSKLRVVVYDEADLALENTATDALKSLFDDDLEEREYTRLTFMVGASVTESLGSLAVRNRILPEGKSFIATALKHRPLLESADLEAETEASSDLSGEEPKTASLKDLNVCLNPGLIHQRVRVEGNNGLLALTRLLRKELQDYDAGKKSQRPRVVVFFPDEVIAKGSIAPLRDALWGEHKLCVLLPKTGVNPLQMMEQFKSNETSVLLATPNSVRGLDFPDVTHVYTLYLPMDDPREYVHLAGRVGRVGQMGSVRGSGGRVVSILKEDEADKMEQLASELGFDFSDIVLDKEEMVLPRNEEGEIDLDDVDLDEVEVEKMRRLFEDTLNLVSSEDAPEDELVDPPSVIDVEFEDNDEEGFQ